MFVIRVWGLGALEPWSLPGFRLSRTLRKLDTSGFEATFVRPELGSGSLRGHLARENSVLKNL